MARPRLFSFFARTPDATALIPPPFSVAAGLQSEPPDAAVTALTEKLASVTAERDQARAAYTAGKDQCAQLEASIAAMKAEAATLNQSLAAAIAERDTLKAENTRTRADLTQEIRNTELATLAASQGVPAGAEIVPANGPGKSKADELEEVLTEIKAATDPGIKGALALKARGIRESIRSGK